MVQPNYYEGLITLSPGTIFVFGSNPEGRHGAGAAKVAREKFGAVYGKGEGLYGNSYAIPTKDLRVRENNGLRSISPESIIASIKRMYECALRNPDKQFKIAYTHEMDKTSLNGYTGREMLNMFKLAGTVPQNVYFSKLWVDNWNHVIEKSGYCVFYKKTVDKNCWQGCAAFCRYHECCTDVYVNKPAGSVRAGFKNNKWKDMPNFYSETELITTGEPDFDNM